MAPWNNFKLVWAFISSQSPPPDLEDGDISNSISQITKDPVGRGGFCDLYLGRHPHYGTVALRRPRHVAYDEATIRRFHREVSLLCKIAHKNILPFLGTCTRGQDFYMVSPFMKNGDLRQWIEKGHRFNRAEILHQIADALAHLHSNEIVHGDIKAQNVLVSDEGTALLCDFGLAKALDSMVTSTDVKGRGSSRWMAPELFDNNPKTKESDIYAFGMTIAEVLTGKTPLHHVYEHAVAMQVLANNARPLRPDVIEEESHDTLWTAAEKCWATDPSDRPLAACIFKPLLPALQISESDQQDRSPASGEWHLGTPGDVIPSPGSEVLGVVRRFTPAPMGWVLVDLQQPSPG